MVLLKNVYYVKLTHNIWYVISLAPQYLVGYVSITCRFPTESAIAIHAQRRREEMALCSLCGGFPDINVELDIGSAMPYFETDPYCSKCGKRRNVRCSSCGGKGYTYTESLIPQYCSRCGRRISKKVRTSCMICSGTGRVPHICMGPFL